MSISAAAKTPRPDLVRTEFRIRGMDCAEEVSLLRREMSRVEGVFDLVFDVVTGRMTVEFDRGRTGPEDIARAVAGAGMKAEPWRDAVAAAEGNWWQRHGHAALAASSGLCVALAMTAHALEEGGLLKGILVHEGGERLPGWGVAAAVLGILLGMASWGPKAWRSLRNLRLDMNVLVAISVAGAAYLNEWLEGSTLAFLFALANLLEAWSLEKARRAVRSLIEEAPRQATVLHGHGEHRMPVETVSVGSLVRVKPGERIPFDGDVVAGASDVDQALITGESVPVPKEAGSSVYAGTLNCDGVLELKTTRAAEDTMLARVVRMVSDASQRRAPSEQFVERFARVYTPAMIALAAAVATFPPLFLGGDWSQWFYRGMLTLLISCPCALVISTPVSIVAALTAAARRGVLIKGGAFLELAARLRALAFDKTGVLTRGEPEVETIHFRGHASERDTLGRILALELRSEHPVARAVVRYCKERRIEAAAADDFLALPGRGAQIRIGTEAFWAGGNRILAEQNVDLEAMACELPAADDPTHMTVYYGAGAVVQAVVRLADRVRPEAAPSIAALRRLGIAHIAMLTGDSAATAQAVSRETGIDEVHAEMLPNDKMTAVERLRGVYGVVAMTGDGINDAQAMAAASLGIALGRRSTDVALETADIILMSDDLGKLPFLVRHARQTLRVIHQNVAIALVSKAIFLGLACAGLATLWMAVAADMGATMVVTFNGLRMLRARGERA